jgi:hypothetical protein
MDARVEVDVGLHIGAAQRLRQRLDQALVQRLRQRQAAHRHRALQHVDQALIVRRCRLAAEFVVDLHPVVVGRVVRGRDVQAPHRTQARQREGQLGRREEALRVVRVEHVGGDAVGGVDLAREERERA